MEVSFVSAPRPRRRRREVEERLASNGLLLGPRRLELGEGGVPEDRVAWAEGLAAALADLGPVFAGFGRYLGYRADLLTEEQCRVLRELAPADGKRRLEESGETVRDVLVRELGAPPEELFARFEEVPASVALLHQVHRAQGTDGLPLRVRLIRPGGAGCLETDLPALVHLGRAWPGSRQELDEVIDGYRRALEEWLDGSAQARSLAELAAVEDGCELFRVPRVDPRGTGGRVLTVERLIGDPLEGAGGGPPERAALARRLCLWWLERALGGGTFPVEAEMVVLADGRLCPLAGCFAALGGGVGRELASYLRAAAGGDRDAACEHLARAAGLEGYGRGEPPSELRRSMRQGVALREGEDGDGLAHRLLFDWRTVRRCGLTLPRELDAFYRGLSWVSVVAGRLAATGEPLRYGLEDLWWRGALSELSRAAEPERLMSTLESFVEAASLLPQGLDRALADGDGVFRAAGSAESRSPAGRAGPAAIGGGALVLALLAVGLATPPLVASLPAVAAVWAEAVGGGLFVLLSALLLLGPGGRR